MTVIFLILIFGTLIAPFIIAMIELERDFKWLEEYEDYIEDCDKWQK